MVLTLLVAVPAAKAGTRANIVADCYDDGKLDGNYSPSEIRDARNNLPADIDQYSDCRDVLARALGGSGDKALGGGAGGGALGGGGGGGRTRRRTSPRAARRSSRRSTRPRPAAATSRSRSATTVVPGAAGLASDAAQNAIPVTVLVALILLGLVALAGAVPYVRRRVHARRLA